MYKIGDKIVYPMHGAGIIETIDEQTVLGENRQYYVLTVPRGDMRIMIPIAKSEEIGIRVIIDSENVDDVMAVLSQESSKMPANWNRRYRENMDKLKTGDIFIVAEVVRDLTRVDRSKPLSTGEKKMLLNAKQILESEIALATEKTPEEIETIIDTTI